MIKETIELTATQRALLKQILEGGSVHVENDKLSTLLRKEIEVLENAQIIYLDTVDFWDDYYKSCIDEDKLQELIKSGKFTKAYGTAPIDEAVEELENIIYRMDKFTVDDGNGSADCYGCCHACRQYGDRDESMVNELKDIVKQLKEMNNDSI